MRLFLNVLLRLTTFTAAQSIQGSGPGLAVTTQQGVVIGTLILPSVRQFLGIPFAAAQRWQAPTLPPVRSGPFQATKFANGCLQNLVPANAEYLRLNGNGGLNVPSGEDCLAVNIWAPSTNRKQNTAVLVWIYGGGFVFGTVSLIFSQFRMSYLKKQSGIPVFNGTNMVRDNDDITLVTINYRLNIFGQPNPPKFSDKENVNFGLLDVEAAIQWVHANIANFWGDPNRITIFGQSAGGAAVDAYTFTHPHDTIVKGMSFFELKAVYFFNCDPGVIEQSGRYVVYMLHMLGQKSKIAFSISGTATGVELTGTPGNHTDWNTVSGCWLWKR